MTAVPGQEGTSIKPRACWGVWVADPHPSAEHLVWGDSALTDSSGIFVSSLVSHSYRTLSDCLVEGQENDTMSERRNGGTRPPPSAPLPHRLRDCLPPGTHRAHRAGPKRRGRPAQLDPRSLTLPMNLTPQLSDLFLKALRACTWSHPVPPWNLEGIMLIYTSAFPFDRWDPQVSEPNPIHF